MKIRRYHQKDIPELITLLRSNTPQFFAPSEENDFVEYLKNDSKNYFVVEADNKIIGSGGFNHGIDGGSTTRISWDMVHPKHQGMGVGTALTRFRIDEIKKNPGVNQIVVRTTQFGFRFYEKVGFQLEQVEKDFWAQGFDLYQMSFELKEINTSKL